MNENVSQYGSQKNTESVLTLGVTSVYIHIFQGDAGLSGLPGYPGPQGPRGPDGFNGIKVILFQPYSYGRKIYVVNF